VHELRDEQDESRYELLVDGELGGMVQYRIADGVIDLLHTVVLPSHRGQGLAGELVAGAFADARARGMKVVTTCPYAASWAADHLEVADLIAERRRPAD